MAQQSTGNKQPKFSERIYLTDSGLETTLVFHDELELPCFAAFDLLKDDDGYNRLTDYFHRHASIAAEHDAGFILESVTWRANPDWGTRLGYSAAELDAVNRKSIGQLLRIREHYGDAGADWLVSGCVGPRGDGYVASDAMSPDEAATYHATQIQSFASAGADMIGAITMTNAEEAIGVVRAAKAADLACVISFTVETDGTLPTGQKLQHAIESVDRETGEYPAYYMINCAHPTHFLSVLHGDADWLGRIGGIRANASKLSHAELDEAEELDDGDPVELAGHFRSLTQILPNLKVVGGCCGTDHRHIAAIAAACTAA